MADFEGQLEELVGFIRASRLRRAVFDVLRHGPRTPSEISRCTGLHISHVSRVLSELCSVDIAYCLTPGRRKGRLYGLRVGTRIDVQRVTTGGQLPDREPSQAPGYSFVPKVKGEAMMAGVAATLDVLGSRAIFELSRAFGVDLLGFDSERWYPIEIHHRYLALLQRFFSSEVTDVCRAVGRRSIGYLRLVQEILTRKLDLSSLVERVPLVHGAYFNFGRFDVRPLEGRVEITQYDMMPTREFCAARLGNYEGVLTLKGIKATVVERACSTRGAQGCTFTVKVIQ